MYLISCIFTKNTAMKKILNIAISGATGFIGSNLVHHFSKLGYNMLPITRKHISTDNNKDLKNILAKSQIVINLAGAPINRLWTKSYKKELYDSRMLSTRKIVNTIDQLTQKPQLLISTSAIGYYPSIGCSDENSSRGDGFLSRLCEDWENEAKKVDDNVRLVIARLGVVLSHNGGAFKQMSLSTKFKIASTIGDANHLLSWISIEDLVSIVECFVKNSDIRGTVNVVSPSSISNEDMLSHIARHYKCLVKLRIPSFVARLALGESANFIINSPHVVPKKLIEFGYVFKTPTFIDFLKEG